MKEKEYNVVTLEDGIEYTEIDRLVDNENTYVFLSNIDKPDDFCIRKLIHKDNEDFIIGLNDNHEFDRVFTIFYNKYQN